jgi:hypothetical protein
LARTSTFLQVLSITIRITRLSVRRTLAPCAVVLAALTHACGGSGGDTPTTPTPVLPKPQGPPPNLSGVRIIGGGGQADTIYTILPQALVVEVRDSTGAVAANRTVRFAGANAWMAQPGTLGFSDFMTAVTDAQGLAQARVRLGFGVGTARVAVTVTGLGVTDTVSFTVNRGEPARFVMEPRDTIVSPGATYTIKVLAITDQGDNPIPGVVPTFTATGASVTSAGVVTVPSTAPVRARILVSYQQATDSAKVTVYPRIPMVIAKHNLILDPGDIGGSGVGVINSDGTGFTQLVKTTSSSIAPSSVAATSSVVFYQGDPSANSKVWVVQPGVAPRLLLPGETRTESWPRLSPDGVWVYFVRDLKSLWRVKLDGTALDSLTSVTTSRTYMAPAIAPDGRTVAMEDGTGLQIIDVITREKTTLSVPCPFPSFSPDGTWFACTENNLSSPSPVWVMRTDGTSRRVVITFGAYEGPDWTSSVDWTPDGTWLLETMSSGYAQLIEIYTGELISLLGIPTAYAQAMFVH